jgi:uncharacterized protein
MIGLLGAVIVASFLGSLHCVGMCGPLALLSIGAVNTPAKLTRRESVVRLTNYHLGRLLTYITMGVTLATAALVVDSGGAALGVSGIAARIAGSLLIAIGIWNCLKLLAPQWVPSGHSRWGLWIAKQLASFRKPLQSLPNSVRAFAMGTLTTLLPCGWLYIFALVAGGTADPLTAMMVMLAFWLGTLPALSAVVSGVAHFGSWSGRLGPWCTAALLIATGVYTATGRAATDLAPLAMQAASISGPGSLLKGEQTLDQLESTPLPCCAHCLPTE